MSNLSKQAVQECTIVDGCGAIELIIQPKNKDLGGFSVRRSLPVKERKMIGPWVFFDHMGPATFPAGEGINVRPHPHINIATVTYLFEGEILHRDSLGSLQAIQPGDINLMVAGSGIAHSERERPEITATQHTLHGLQLWLALPEKDEEAAAEFHHYAQRDIPTTTVAGVAVRVMMGSAYGLTSPVKTFAETVYVEAHLKAGQTITLPQADERAVYVVAGKLTARATEIAEHSLAVLNDQPDIVLRASEDSRIAIIGGEKMTPRFIDWNFVSSRKDRIAEAIADWKAGNFASVPGDDKEFIPYPGT